MRSVALILSGTTEIGSIIDLRSAGFLKKSNW
jgi:hypothetical protein